MLKGFETESALHENDINAPPTNSFGQPIFAPLPIGVPFPSRNSEV